MPIHTTKDAQEFGLFPGVPAVVGKVCTFKLSQIKKAWEKHYPHVDLMAFIQAYAGGTLESNKEVRTRNRTARNDFFDAIASQVGPRGKEWIETVKASQLKFRQEHNLYRDNPSTAMSILLHVAKALDAFPQRPTYLPVFAQKVTGNPHFFDITRPAGSILVNALACLANVGPESNVTSPEWSAEILATRNILRDDSTNGISCSGITGVRGKTRSMWMVAAAEEGSTFNLPLREVIRWDYFEPVHGESVHVVENPGVFASLVDEHVENHGQVPCLICSGGQFSMATWILFGKLIKSGAIVHYSGDFDPEGLLMAHKLKERYPEQVEFWRLTREDYLRAKPSELIESENRLTQLKGVTAAGLQGARDAIATVQKVAYQEALLEFLFDDIEKV